MNDTHVTPRAHDGADEGRGSLRCVVPFLIDDVTSSMRSLSRTARLCLFVAWTGLLIAALLHLPDLCDDAFIVYRYATRLAHGGTFGLNDGQPVEGVTCLLWVVTLAAAVAAGLDAPLVAKLIGMLLVAGIPALALALSRRLAPFRVSVAGACMLGASAPLAVWAVGGLETGAYSAVLALALYSASNDLERPGRRLPVGALAFAPLVLLRPEGILLALPYLVLLCSQVIRRRERLRFAGTAVAILGLTVGGVTLWRLATFGVPVPNTFYAKVAYATTWQPPPGSDYLAGFFAVQGGWALLALAGLALVARRPGFTALLLAGTVMVQVSAILIEGGDYMEGWRFAVPMVAPLAVLAGSGFERVRDVIQQARWRAPLRAASIFLVCAILVALALPEHRRLLRATSKNTDWLEGVHMHLGMWLRQAAPPGELGSPSATVAWCPTCRGWRRSTSSD
ncbi:MAG TPA: hypothetical protein VJ801_13725 [Polyangia bacterium]|nr:hypothetical protein [Polyangia bacterium]